MAGTTNIFTNICSVDCANDFVFPAAISDPNCLSAGLHKSQIGDLVFRPTGAASPFGASWTGEGATLVVTADEIDNDSVLNTKSRHLRGVGSVGEFEYQISEGAYGEDLVVEGVAPFEFTVANVTQLNRLFGKALQCNPKNYTVYIGTEFAMFGLTNGMKLRNLRVQMPLNGGREDYETIIFRGEIVSQGGISPERTANNPLV